MSHVLRFARRYRVAVLALAVSAALHAAVFVGMPQRLEAGDESQGIVYTASLDPSAPPAPSAASTKAAAVKAPRAPRAVRSRIAPPPLPLPQAELAPLPALAPEPEIAALAPLPQLQPAAPDLPDQVALARTLASAADAAPEAAPFPVEALPGSLSISYKLTSAFADGHAVYSWTRDGDNYRITGEAEAEGFFTLFLEGRILQESRGTVTSTGLRPGSFSERRPNTAAEGIEFDWDARQVTMERGDQKKTSPLSANTVDWLSMIFQLAHQPPRGQAMAMSVYTQRKLYKFDLRVLGEEQIDIPLGKVRALHLRHVDPVDPTEIVDVWLGIEQHYLPVKMRYPVAKNRLMVEQIATGMSER